MLLSPSRVTLHVAERTPPYGTLTQQRLGNGSPAKNDKNLLVMRKITKLMILTGSSSSTSWWMSSPGRTALKAPFGSKAMARVPFPTPKPWKISATTVATRSLEERPFLQPNWLAGIYRLRSARNSSRLWMNLSKVLHNAEVSEIGQKPEESGFGIKETNVSPGTLRWKVTEK